MARYMKTAAELKRLVNNFINQFAHNEFDSNQELAKELGYIINLAIRCAPRSVQSTVRLNIVKEAVGEYCKVWMTKEMDEITGREYNKIHIEPRS